MKSTTNKRLFIGLLFFTLFVFLATILVILYIYLNELEFLYQNILIGVIFISVILVIVLTLGLSGIVLTIVSAKTFSFLLKLMIFAIKILYPIAIFFGKTFNISKDKIKSSFIEVNNHLVLTKDIKVKPNKILILAPHCIQQSECQHKITNNINNCRKCGKCNISDLIEIINKFKVKLAVVPGGTQARRIIKEYKPKAIVAIACERDLTQGIQDTNPLPVIGILNYRPEGPCFNCKVVSSEVEKAINLFLGQEANQKFKYL